MDEVIILGAGGHGKVVLDILLAQGAYRPVGFVDDNPSMAGRLVCGLPVLGRLADLPRLRGDGLRYAVIAIGDNATRLRQRPVLEGHGFELVTAIHPTAFVSPRNRIGRGVVVAPRASVVVDCVVGDLAIVNTAAVVDHEGDLGEGAHVGPAAALSGRVRLGQGAFVGTGAAVIQGRQIGRFATVGAGAAVVRDVPDFATAVGVPARVIKVSPPPDGL
jgi:UDP-perosamine 4-acetyltransferase